MLGSSSSLYDGKRKSDFASKEGNNLAENVSLGPNWAHLTFQA